MSRAYPLPLSLATAVLLAAAAALAADVDPATLYDLSTQGTSTQVKPGGHGTFVLSVTTHAGAHVSDDAPLKLQLTGRNVTLGKSALTRADSVGKKAPGKAFADPRFEVPFTATQEGSGAVEATLTFFVCTENLCSRQQKRLSVPVDVK